ncbi:MAG TPA: hypothetical protein VMV15_00790 [Candidatus Binataceae bacterium]|nr:hypothetical protein [Candidatus Binataceae bacterium]
MPLSRSRYIALTVGTGAMGLVTAIFLVGAPPIPAAVGVVLAVAWLIWRSPAA